MMGTSLFLGHFKRLTYACVGVGLIGLAVFQWANHDSHVPVWRYVAGIAGGLFFVYVSLMYYLPKARQSRADLNAVLDEAEAAERTSNTSPSSAK